MTNMFKDYDDLKARADGASNVSQSEVNDLKEALKKKDRQIEE